MPVRTLTRRRLVFAAIAASTAVLLAAVAIVQVRATRSWSSMQERIALLERTVAAQPRHREPLWGDATAGLAFAHHERAADLVHAIEKAHGKQLVSLLPITEAKVADPDLREQWRSALAALREASHATDTTMPQGSELAPPPYGVVNLLSMRWLANVATFEARELVREDHDVEAVRCSLDAATLALDVIGSGALINQMIGTATLAIAVSPWTDERLTLLSPDALRLLADGLARLDQALPVCLDMHGELLLTGRELAKVPTGGSLASFGSAWRYGFSTRAMIAAAFDDYADLVAELTAIESAGWTPRKEFFDRAIAARMGTQNPITAMLVPNLVSAEQSLREGIAAVRLLRMALALHRGEDAPPLPDPLGTGALCGETTAEGTRLSSAGTAARPQLERIVRR